MSRLLLCLAALVVVAYSVEDTSEDLTHAEKDSKIATMQDQIATMQEQIATKNDQISNLAAAVRGKGTIAGDSAFEPTKSMAKTGRKLLGGCSGTGCSGITTYGSVAYAKYWFLGTALGVVMPHKKEVQKGTTSKTATSTCISGCTTLNGDAICNLNLDIGSSTTCTYNCAFTADTTCTFQIAATYSLETHGSSYKLDVSSYTSTWDDDTTNSCKEYVAL